MGTPQGVVISPLLANIYLHHAFDMWMQEQHLQNPFERYADDIVIHCRSKAGASKLMKILTLRMRQYGLELHPEKAKIVYCKNYLRNQEYINNSFVFLGFSFQPRTIKGKTGAKQRLLVFNAGICQRAKADIRAQLREGLQVNWTVQTLEWFAQKLNRKIIGWVN